MVLQHTGGGGRRDPLPGKHNWYVLLELSSQRDADWLIEQLTEFFAAALADKNC